MRRPQKVRVALPEGGQVSVRHWDGQGRPLILLHGFLDCAGGWDRLARATHRPCYAIDLPGFGDSSVPQEGSLDAYAGRVWYALEALDLDGVTLVGHSLGGAVAKTMVGQEPDYLVDSLALITPAGFGSVELAKLATHPLLAGVISASFPLAMINPLVMDLAYRVGVSGGRPAPRTMVRRSMRAALRGSAGPRLGLQALAAMSRTPQPQLLAPSEFRGPVSALWGSRDRLIPRHHASGVLSVFPHADVTIWPDLAHHPQEEQPQRLAAYVEQAAARGRRWRRERRRSRRSA